MRTVGEMLTARSIEMLRDPSYRMRLALRDEPDYYNDGSTESPRSEPVKITELVFRPRPVDKELDQLKSQVRYLQDKIMELRAEKKKQDYY